MRPRHPQQRLTLQAILPHLRKARRQPDGSYMACCPAHDDQNPSLHLSESPDGVLLWHCFAGCSQEAVQRELERLAGIPHETSRGLNLADYAHAKGLDAEKLRAWGLSERSRGIAIPYKDRSGNIRATRFRHALSGENRFCWHQGDAPLLYGLWRLSEWHSPDALYLCEGETDTLTLWHADLPALGIPGASLWKPEWWREMEAFHRIVLIPDTDPAGEQLVQKLAETCPESIQERVQVLQLPEGVKDANELWQRVDADPERFKEALAQCALYPLTAPSTRTLQPISAKQLLQQPAPAQPYLWDGIIPKGAIALLAGREKGRGGKTTLAFGLIRALLNHEAFLGRETQPMRVLYISEENSASLRNKLHALHIDSDDLLILPREAFGATLAHALKRHQDELLQLCTTFEIGLVVVDTFQAFGGLRGDAENQVGSVMDALSPILGLNSHGITVLLIHHHAKATGEPRGSTALTAAVDVVINLTRQQGDNRDNARLLTWEGRWGIGELVYLYNPETADFTCTGTPEEHELATLQQRVLELLQNAPEPLTEKQISELLQAPRQRVNIALRRLLETQPIQREGEGKRNAPYRYSFLHSDYIGSGMNAETRGEEEEATLSSHGNRFCTHMRACTKHAETKSAADSVSAFTPGAIYMDAHAQTEPLSPLHDTSVMLDWERGARTRDQHKRRRLRNGHESAYAVPQQTLPL